MDSKPFIPQNHTHAEMLEFHAKTLKEIFDISPDDYKVVLLNTDGLYVSQLVETFEKTYGIKLSIHNFRNSHMNWEIRKEKPIKVGFKLPWHKPKVVDLGDLGNNTLTT